MKNIDSKLSNEWLDISIAQELAKLLYFRKECHIPKMASRNLTSEIKKQGKFENFGILI